MTYHLQDDNVVDHRSGRKANLTRVRRGQVNLLF